MNINPSVNLTTFIHYGVVEERDTDTRSLGRCRIRVVGIHTENKIELPTKDLPWAYPVQPVNSAAMSGIGISPVGVVEGTWCLIVFRDEYKQHPLILGTIGGIPEPLEHSNAKVTQVNALVTSSGAVVTDSSGTPIGTGSSESVATVNTNEVKKPSQLTISDTGLAAIKKHERLSSLVKGKNKWGSDSTSNSTSIYSYLDSGGVWTIGWGNTFLENSSPVTESTVITKAQADSLFAVKIKEFESSARRYIKVPITQGMFDAIVSMMYNAGAGGIGGSQFMSTLNGGDYNGAAALIPTTRATVKGASNSGLTNRRNSEKTMFMSSGIPKQDASATTDKPAPTESVESRATSNPVVIPTDKEPKQTTTSQTTSQDSNEGFRDPKGKYPLQSWLNEPDTHRLARHDKLSETIVAVKESARVTGVESAFGSSWDQPRVPYNAKYPFNQVRGSESGHIEEYDDTPNNERLHWYHRKGTFEEIDRNGTLVRRIVGDGFTIMERHGNVLIKGNCNVTIQGDSRVLVENNAFIEVRGDSHSAVTGNWNVGVGGSVNIHSAGDINLDGANINLNSGPANGIAIPSKGSSPKEFGELTLPDRTSELHANYETPEEGDPTSFHEAQIANGTITRDDVTPNTTTTKEETKAEDKPPVASTSTSCDGITDDTISSQLQLSSRFTLGNLGVGSSGIPKPKSTHYGRPAAQIVCNMKKLAIHVLDPIKEKYPNMILTSVWRSEPVNTSVGGSKTSDHLSGEAADMQFSGFTREQTYRAAIEIQKLLPSFKQIILEYKGSSTWIHVSFAENGNKNQSLTIDAAINKTISSTGFVLR